MAAKRAHPDALVSNKHAAISAFASSERGRRILRLKGIDPTALADTHFEALPPPKPGGDVLAEVSEALAARRVRVVETQRCRNLEDSRMIGTLRDGTSNSYLDPDKAAWWRLVQPAGEYHPPGSQLRGMERSEPAQPQLVAEPYHHPHFLRHPAATNYRFVSLWSGAGVADMAAARAGSVPVFAAEISKEDADLYAGNLGVTPYPSNQALFEDLAGLKGLVTQIHMGFECTSVAANGSQEGLGHSSWRDFDRAVEGIKELDPLTVMWENVPGLLESKECWDKVTSAFEGLGYCMIHGVADPKDFGVGVSRPRLFGLCMKQAEADLIGFSKLNVVKKPYSGARKHPKCIADYLVRPRSTTVPEDAIDWLEFKAAEGKRGRVWDIEWREKYETKAKRDSVPRDFVERHKRPIIMGHAFVVGEEVKTYTGFKVCHVFGLLPAITRSKKAEGPGKNSPLCYDPLDGSIRTLGQVAISKLWHTEGMGLSVRQMGKSAHPVPYTANALLLNMCIDKVCRLKGSIPGTVAVDFRTNDDVVEPSMWAEVERWSKDVVAATEAYRAGKGTIRVKPYVCGDQHTKFWARGWVFKLANGSGTKPTIVGRCGRTNKKIDLSKLDLDGYDDPGVVVRLEWFGLNGSPNPPRKTGLYANDKSCVDHEVDFLAALDKEEKEGWVTFTSTIPYWPFRMNPCFMIEQGEKKRRIHHASKQHAVTVGPKPIATNSNHVHTASRLRWEMGTNQSKVHYCGSSFELVRMDQIIALATMLILVARVMRARGWLVVVVLGWADLWSAYNQVYQDPVTLWTNGLGYVTTMTRYQAPQLMFGEGHTTDFGQWYSPQGFSTDVTRTVTYSASKRLAEAEQDYPLQHRWRQELADRPVQEAEFDNVMPRRITGLQQSWRERVDEVNDGALLQTPIAKSGRFWVGLDPADDLTHSEPEREPSPSVSGFDVSNCSSQVTYLDDMGLLAIVDADPTTGQPYKEGIKSGEHLRRDYIRGEAEAANLQVVADQRSLKKWKKGVCAVTQTLLGKEWCFDLDRPTVGLPAEKKLRLKILVMEASKYKRTIPHKVLESTAHKLAEAGTVVVRGKLYVSGLFAALKLRDESGENCYTTNWMRRNLRWWIQYFDLGCPPVSLLIWPPCLEQKFCPHTDASTSWGYGGWWIVGSVCYYFRGEWTDAEKKLINSSKKEKDGTLMAINYLEMAAVLFLLDVSGGHFEEKRVTFFCDNEGCCRLLRSFKTRTEPMSCLVESIDIELTKHNIDFDIEWIATKKNVGADALSRDGDDAVSEFKSFISSEYGVTTFTQVYPSAKVRDLSRFVRTSTSLID